MRISFPLLAALFVQSAQAIPHTPFDVNEITGEVDFAVWRSAITLERVFAMPKGKEQNTTRDSLPEHWIIMPRNVKGLAEDQRATLSQAFAITPKLPVDWSRKRYLKVQDKNYLYLRINGKKNWPIKLGSTIKIKRLHYWGYDFSGFIVLGELAIDGKRVVLPLTPQNRKYKQPEVSDAVTPPGAKQEKGLPQGTP